MVALIGFFATQLLLFKLDSGFVVCEAFPRFSTGAEASEGCNEGLDDAGGAAEEDHSTGEAGEKRCSTQP